MADLNSRVKAVQAASKGRMSQNPLGAVARVGAQPFGARGGGQGLRQGPPGAAGPGPTPWGGVSLGPGGPVPGGPPGGGPVFGGPPGGPVSGGPPGAPVSGGPPGGGGPVPGGAPMMGGPAMPGAPVPGAVPGAPARSPMLDYAMAQMGPQATAMGIPPEILAQHLAANPQMQAIIAAQKAGAPQPPGGPGGPMVGWFGPGGGGISAQPGLAGMMTKPVGVAGPPMQPQAPQGGAGIMGGGPTMRRY